MEFELGIAHRASMPRPPILDLAKDLRGLGLRVETEEIEDSPFSGIEWAIPAATALIIAKSYADGFIKEMGKEHYLFLKKRLGNFARNMAPTGVSCRSTVSE